ncbi:MAG: queuosine precursor transporter [Gammaproteobacteria bacterium]
MQLKKDVSAIFSHQSLIFIVATQLCLTLAAATVGYAVLKIGPTIQSGATLIFPLTYVISDITTEVYGYKIARRVIWMTLLFELIFATLVTGVISLPHVSEEAFHVNNTALGGLFRFVASGFCAAIISDFINIYLVSKWKILVKGKYFCIRSVTSTAIAVFIMVIIVIGVAFYGKMPLNELIRLMASAYSFELMYAIIFSYPARLIAEFIKQKESIDVYDIGINFNPFVF